MNFDSVTAVLVKLAAIIRRVMPRPYEYLSALRATWGRHSYFRTTGMLRSAALDNRTDVGFRRLNFPGLSPTGERESTTTLFYRADNCLGI
jgi:hypothetical protein